MFATNRDMDDLLKQFYLPFGGKLNPNNRWVQLAAIIPWDQVEEKYVQSFHSPVEGQRAYPVRVALGALIIKERLGLSDRETTLQIQENPYLQFFLGYTAFVDQEPFHHSSLTHFRQRLGLEAISEINDQIALAAIQAERETSQKTETEKHDDDDDIDGGSQLELEVGEALSVPEVPAPKPVRNKPKQQESSEISTQTDSTNKGALMLDATCAPADIKYPTDLGLLNHAREILEDIIDELHRPHISTMEKPRTYREKARRQYLSVSKQRKASSKIIRKAIRRQLGYVGRNLRTIEAMAELTSLSTLSKRHYRGLLVIAELYRQQSEMAKMNKHAVADRIVSIEQPHVRPIVRGKAGANVEFGAKVAASLVNGYVWIEAVQWDSFNEATTLIASVEAYKQRFDCYPTVILA
ncbi:IS5 family transposase, partial [Paenibacillus puerhi]|uniref:IS5 family transposase n=1 Tax=Paenibacillus puerhi TaxID=2692622 RepID=UPI0013596ED0